MNKLTNILMVMAIAAVAFAIAATAARAAYQDPKLNAVASAVAGHPVIASCATGAHEWSQFEDVAGLAFETDGFTFVGRDNVIYLAPRICDILLADFSYGVTAVGDYWNGLAIKTIIHESVHQRGITDESVTDCTALKLVKQYALSFGYAAKVTQVSYVRVKEGRYRRVTKLVANPALDRLYQSAVAWHKQLPIAYQVAC